MLAAWKGHVDPRAAAYDVGCSDCASACGISRRCSGCFFVMVARRISAPRPGRTRRCDATAGCCSRSHARPSSSRSSRRGRVRRPARSCATSRRTGAAGATWNSGQDPYGRAIWNAERTVPGVTPAHDEVLPFVGPPPTLLVWSAFARFPYAEAAAVWTALLAVALLALAASASSARTRRSRSSRSSPRWRSRPGSVPRRATSRSGNSRCPRSPEPPSPCSLRRVRCPRRSPRRASHSRNRTSRSG